MGNPLRSLARSVKDGLRRTPTSATSPAQPTPPADAGRPASVPASCVPVTVGRHQVWAHPRRVSRWSEVAAANLALVAAALAEAGVDHALIEAEVNRKRILVVPDGRRDAAWDALRRQASGLGVYVALDDRRRTAPQLIQADTPAPESPIWRVFQAVATEAGRYFSAEDAACDVQLWAETTPETPPLGNHELFPPGSLLAPAPANLWTHAIPAPARATVPAEVDGVPVPRLSAIDHRHIFTTAHPIDIVYTWVDGADPAWQQRRLAAMDEGRRAAELHWLADNPSRYASHDELRHSLRSVELYADWVRHIFLVTEGHVPDWLRLDHPKLTVVTHAEIFADPAHLPTFNSHAIESQLHRIDGLSEHFLYLNDDVFFTAPVRPEQFVLANGLAVFHPSSLKIGLGPSVPGDTPVVRAGKNNRALLEQRFAVSPSQRIKHVAHSLRRSVLADLEREFPDQVAATAASRFRSGDDLSIASSLAHYYGFVTGRAVPGPVKSVYADIADPTSPAKLDKLLAQRDADQLCLNETAADQADAEAHQRLVTAFLTGYFPVPSSFEKDA